MTFERWDVVVVPFPFTEQAGSKRRPAVVLTSSAFNGAGRSTMAMITTQAHSPWPGDTALLESSHAGLETECVVRLKLFTLDNRLVVKKLGGLGERDRRRVATELQRYFVD